METKVMRFITMVLRLGVGGLFVWAGVLKALDPMAFLKSIENYQILPHAVALVAAFYLPYLEIFCGLGVIFKRLYAGALAILGCLTLVFLAALLSAWARGLDIDCGCFGLGDGKAHYGVALARDLALLAAIGFLEAVRNFRQSESHRNH